MKALGLRVAKNNTLRWAKVVHQKEQRFQVGAFSTMICIGRNNGVRVGCAFA